MNWIDSILLPQLKVDEGYRTHPYRDTEGILTIGIGRNLESVGLRADEIDLMVSNDIDEALSICRSLFKNFDQLNDVRKSVLANMAFNMGPRLRGFEKTIAMVNGGQYKLAAKEMMDSKWSTQVGARALRLSYQMGSGEL